MANAPYGVRLVVGAAATVIEETRKLPQTILMYPMTLVSQAAHLVMRWQQNVADLVIKGDETLESLFPPKDEQPEWATFDEDLPEGAEGPSIPLPGGDSIDGDRPAERRLALYSVSYIAEAEATKPAARQPKKSGAGPAAVPAPAVVTELD